MFLDRESSETIDIPLLVGFPLAGFVSTAVSPPTFLYLDPALKAGFIPETY